MNIYCTYLTTYKGNLLPPFYIGSSNLKRIQSGYKGSVSSKMYQKIWKLELKNKPELFKTFIISTHKTRKEALDRELEIQLKFKVANNPMYINKAYCNSNGVFGFSGFGKDHWSKQPGKIHNSITNHPRGMSGKSHTEECKIKMSLIQTKDKNHFYGKHHSEESKHKIAVKASNKIWITNNLINLRHEKNIDIPNGFKRGRNINLDKTTIQNRIWVNDGRQEKLVSNDFILYDLWKRGRIYPKKSK